MDSDEAQKGELSANPLLAQLVVVRTEEMMDKLRLLDYEKRFCRKLRIKPLPRHYFALPTNPGEQFHYFTNLAVWLLNRSHGGAKLDQPQEYDDPNATIATIIAEAKKLGLSTNFPPSKLKSGAGEHVCLLLKELADHALAADNFKWKRPEYPEEDTHEEVVQDNASELSLTRMEEEINEEMNESDDEEEGGTVYLDLNSISQQQQHNRSGLNPSLGAVLAGALETTVDPQEWRLEVERVLPSLKVHTRQDNRDWRVHYEQMHQHHDSIRTVLSDTKVLLDKLHQEIAKTLEKISSREKYINSQLEHRIHSFRTAQDQLAEVRSKYKEGSSSVNELARALAQVTAELEGVKAEMDEKGTSMTDAGPVVQIRQGLTRLRNECKQMEVQIGMVEHTLLVAKFKSKSALKIQMTADTTRPPGASGPF